ncbi:MAG TPA: AI-2E family transporter [Syntrophales bacterium]|nr:AI-2E family transporter [Syntrophales bacterium]HOL59656.1 AI-2E family transporter [Syntrophales bacterium]HPO35802.1 AI-2E family transporter [Syntrophales bacterium]
MKGEGTVGPEKVKTVLFFVVVVTSLILFAYLISPFFGPLFWAAVIAGLSFPLHRRILKRLRSPNLSAFLTLLTVTAAIIVPLILVGTLILMESVDMFQALNEEASSLLEKLKVFTARLASYPIFSRLTIDAATLTKAITDGARGFITLLFENIRYLTQNTVVFIAKFFVMLYVLFFFLRDGEALREEVKDLLPFAEEKKAALLNSFTRTAKATLKVTILIGGIQGLLGAILFLVLGVKGALTWGVVMAVASIIPGVGSSIIWAPAGIFMIIAGETVKGLIMLLVGSLVISSVDSLLRPILLKQGVEMHPLMVFLSSLGGIVCFGIMGFVLGPIIGALFLTLISMYKSIYVAERKDHVE